MDDLDILRSLMKESATLPLVEHYGKHKVELIEPVENYTVTISNVPADSVVIKGDAFPAPDHIFQGSRGECRRADYVIIANSGTKKVILCMELKKTTKSEKHIIEQLAGAKCFVAYCQEIGKTFWKQYNFLDDYDYRFISIGHISVAKRKTRITRNRNASVHDAPERVMRIDWPHYLSFNKIV
jgi:hypothetical protein